jgi:signal transduction histidine kinase
MFLLLSPVVIVFAVAALFAAGIAAMSWRRRHLPGAAIFTWLMMAIMLWTLAESFENASITLEAKLFFAKLSHPGIQSVPPLFLMFALYFTRRGHVLTPKRLALLWSFPLAAVLLVFTNEYHHLFWRQVELVPQGIGSDTLFEYGALFWGVTAGQYLLLGMSIALLVRFLVSHRDVYRRQALMVLVGSLLPLLTSLLYIFGRDLVPGVDWTPVALVIAGLLIIYAISRLQLFDIVPVAHGLLVEKTPDALLVLDTVGRVVDANPAAYALLPVARWLVGSHITSLIPRTSGILEMLVDDGDAQACLYVDRNDTLWLDVRCTPLRSPEGNLGGHLLLLRDITAQQAAFQELRRARDAARAAARAKDGFLATMSHELRTPLTGVLGLAEALQNETLGELNARQHRALEIIERSGRRLSSLIGAILDLSSIEAGDIHIQPQLLPAVDLCDQCMNNIREEVARRNHRLSCQINPPDLIVRLDRRRMTEALSYLLDNAAKFMADGGELGLEVCGDSSHQCVRFTVWDRGIGVAPEDQTMIFEPFVQVDGGLARHYGGAGIGLALAHRLVMLHDGQIEVESASSGGSRFTIVLPQSLPVAPARERAA